jgi:hypothetical protein
MFVALELCSVTCHALNTMLAAGIDAAVAMLLLWLASTRGGTIPAGRTEAAPVWLARVRRRVLLDRPDVDPDVGGMT